MPLFKRYGSNAFYGSYKSIIDKYEFPHNNPNKLEGNMYWGLVNNAHTQGLNKELETGCQNYSEGLWLPIVQRRP